MEIFEISLKRTVRKNLGNYEHDERTAEFKARLEDGENPYPAITFLNGLIVDALAGKAAPEPVQEIAAAPAPTPAAAPVVLTPEPVLPVAANDDDGLTREAIAAIVASEPEAGPGYLTNEEPYSSAPEMDGAEFAKQVAMLSKSAGVARVMELLAGRRVSTVPAGERAAFIAALKA